MSMNAVMTLVSTGGYVKTTSVPLHANAPKDGKAKLAARVLLMTLNLTLYDRL